VEKDDGGSIDAKTIPGGLLIGIILIFAGMFVLAVALYYIVTRTVEGDPFGIFRELPMIFLGILLMVIGSMLAFAGVLRKLFGRRRILY